MSHHLPIVCFENEKVMPGEFKGFFYHETNKKALTEFCLTCYVNTTCVEPYTSSGCSSRCLCASVTTEQSTVKASLFVH